MEIQSAVANFIRDVIVDCMSKANNTVHENTSVSSCDIRPGKTTNTAVGKLLNIRFGFLMVPGFVRNELKLGLHQLKTSYNVYVWSRMRQKMDSMC